MAYAIKGNTANLTVFQQSHFSLCRQGVLKRATCEKPKKNVTADKAG